MAHTKEHARLQEKQKKEKMNPGQGAQHNNPQMPGDQWKERKRNPQPMPGRDHDVERETD